jgi:hypothetical protein
MEFRIARDIGRPILHAAAVLAATAVLTLAITKVVAAQTLTTPNSRTPQPTPPTAAKSRPGARAKSCAEFGPGFVAVAGTDACVKVGGSVTIEGTAGR